MTLQLSPGIRNCVRAVIINNDQLLVLRKEYEDGHTGFVLPGGAQDLGETLEQALQRECLEEIGTLVQIRSLIHLADFFKPRETVPNEHRHQLEILFLCTIPDGYQPTNGPHPDKHQTAVEWIAMEQLSNVALTPAALARLLLKDENYPSPVYLGQLEP